MVPLTRLGEKSVDNLVGRSVAANSYEMANALVVGVASNLRGLARSMGLDDLDLKTARLQAL